MNGTNKQPLDSGVPCLNHDCQECCIKTRMPLARSDIERIRNIGYRFKFFVVKKGKERYLKNSAGKCVFLKDRGCNIYEFRPEGCKLYPLIHDVVSGRTFIHEFCPYGYEFKFNKEEVNRLNLLFEELGI